MWLGHQRLPSQIFNRGIPSLAERPWTSSDCEEGSIKAVYTHSLTGYLDETGSDIAADVWFLRMVSSFVEIEGVHPTETKFVFLVDLIEKLLMYNG